MWAAGINHWWPPVTPRYYHSANVPLNVLKQNTACVADGLGIFFWLLSEFDRWGHPCFCGIFGLSRRGQNGQLLNSRTFSCLCSGFNPDWKGNTLHCATHSTKSETWQLPPGTLRVQLSLLSTPFYFMCASICISFCRSSGHWLNMQSNKCICLSLGLRKTFHFCFLFRMFSCGRMPGTGMAYKLIWVTNSRGTSLNQILLKRKQLRCIKW